MSDFPIFDTHAHYDDEAFDEDRQELLAELPRLGIGRVVNMGSDLAGCRGTIALTEAWDYIYGAIGVHPSDCGEMTEEDLEWLRQECRREKIVAVGEIGLDYYWPEPDHEIQKKWFRRQLGLARELGLPVVIHSREAAQDTYEIMCEENAGEIGGVVHCFSYSPEMAERFVRMGFYIGIGGVLTFKNARKIREVAERIPLSRIVLETDCPYLAPVPHRGKRNNSSYLRYVVPALAEIKGVSADEVRRVTWENGRELYRMEE
ncbi:MAG: TatD family hydrolase [Lachnospiraceae bacterium]|nr:TatD family hydrolase [Lachnospiraceae bacterium]